MVTQTRAVVPFRQRDELDPMRLGEVFAESGFFADSRQAAQCVTKILAGRELGIGPVASMTGIFIVKGRITIGANVIGSLIKRSGRYDYRVRDLDNEKCAIDFYEGGEKIGESAFTKKDAETAGLATGENWKHYPRNMLFARALSNGAKWFCPDLFAGPIYTPDELGAALDAESGEPLIDLRTGEVVDAEIVGPKDDPRIKGIMELEKRLHERGIEIAPVDLTALNADSIGSRGRFLQGVSKELKAAKWGETRDQAAALGVKIDPLPEASVTTESLAAWVERWRIAVEKARPKDEVAPAVEEEAPAPQKELEF